MSDTTIAVTARVHLAADEIEMRFVRASGPGGQHVNKASTAVELRFDAARSPSLPDDTRARLLALAGQRATEAGVIVIRAERHRSQAMNREDALERLIRLVRAATVVPRARVATRPTAASQRRRLDKKVANGLTKRLRGRVQDD
jgi:ribosome-associated protein